MTPTTAAIEGRRIRGPLLLAAALGITSAMGRPLLLLGGVEPVGTLVATVGIDVICAIGAGVALAAVGRRRTGIERTAWTLLGLGPVAWAAGSMIWAGYLADGRSLPAPSTADICYLLLPISWCVAIVLLSGRPATDSRSARTLRTFDLLDSLIVAVSTLLVLWILAFRTSGLGTSDRDALMTMVYPVADSVVITLGIRAIRRGTPDRRALSVITAGMLWCTVGDVAFLAAVYLSDLIDAAPSLVDATWVVGFTIIGGGAWIALGGREHLEVPQGTAQLRRQLGSGTFPLLIGGFAATVGLVDLAIRDGGTWSVATLVLIMVLLLTRQLLTLRENRRLSVDLVASIRTLERQAGHDLLTSLPNRQHLDERLRGLVATSGRPGCSAVAFIDIDRLKPVNDSLGHRHGDRLIRVVADRLGDRWPGDVVRFGGDELVVLIRNRSSLDAIRAEVDGMVEDMHRADTFDDVVLRPSVSVGIAAVEPDSTPHELLRRADVALYHVKQSGRGHAAVFVSSMDEAARRQLAIEAQLQEALDADQFELHYQPVISLDTGRITGVEALLRWHHHELGLLTPDCFLTAADTLGVLRTLGRRSLVEATARLSELQSRSRGRPVAVSVNLSAGELDDTVVSDVEEALRSSGVDPSLLILEITEDVIVDGSVRRTLSQLRRLGVGIAIDDFGTGNSSLRQLGEYPATTLKIDRSFVEGMSDEEDRAIVAAIIELAGRLGLSTVAEGVETAEQAALLASFGCDHAQGWLFEPAIPFDQLVQRWFDVPGPAQAVDGWSPQRRPSATSAPSMIRSSRSATDGSSSITPTT